MSSRGMFWVVLAGAALLFLVRADSTPLMDPDESRFARTSVEMLRSGDLVVPHFGGEPRLVKPPLLHWIQSLIFGRLGVSEWAARLHAAFSTLGSILLVAWIARRRFGDEGGVWAAVILTTMPMVLVPARVGTLDALLAVHVLAVVACDLAGPSPGGKYRGLAVGGLLGLAFLTKGPIGVLLPLLIVLAGRTADRRDLLPSPRAVSQAVAGWSLVVLPWALAFLHRVGAGTAVATLRTEVLDRYFDPTIHHEPVWYYAKVSAVAFLPWLAPLVLAMGRAWRLRHDPVARTALYAAAGLLAGLVFFSLGRSKLPNYILPLAPLAAILVTWELGQELEAPRRRTLGPTLLSATLAALAVLSGLAAAFQLEDVPRRAAIVGAAVFSAAGLAAGYAAIRRRPRWVYGIAAAASASFLLVAVTVLFPSIGQSRSAAGLVDSVPALSSDRPVVTVEIRVPSLVFYLDRATEVLDMGGFEDRLAVDDEPLFVLANVDLAAVPAGVMLRLQEVGRHGKLIVFEKEFGPGAELDGV